jgi:hypothetical protein
MSDPAKPKSEHDENEQRGFKVTDRRIFAPEGGEENAPSPEPAAAAPKAKGAQGALPEVDFSTLVLSLSTSALLHLGQVPPEPGAEPSPPNLPLAKQSIDLLALLQQKTRGNLTRDEDQLLGNLLYDLRLRYVNATRG